MFCILSTFKGFWQSFYHDKIGPVRLMINRIRRPKTEWQLNLNGSQEVKPEIVIVFA